ncbi:ATP-binding protein [Thermodesulfovibrio yellowstonii]|uniref:chemotaxis protein CheA n=1 Tax=Thermodesulfovibrio yellowstonii TaxID=28262 RepID=UPI003C7C88F1
MKNPLLQQFIIESRDYLQRIGEILIKLEEDGESKDLLNELFRLVHTLKGNSGLFDFPMMTKLLHASEDLMNRLREEALKYSSEIADLLLESMDIVSQMIDEIEAYDEPQLSTNEAAQEKASSIREIISVGEKPEETKKENEISESYNYSAIPEEVRMKMVKTLFEGKSITLIHYQPEKECFYKGEDPFLVARKTPEIIWGKFYLREKIEEIETFDIYSCITDFEIISTAEVETLKEHFQYVLDQIKIFKPKISALIIPQGDKNGGPVYEDFVQDFRNLLKDKNIPLLKNSLRAIKELTASNLFVASCLRWIDTLIDYIPNSMPYIEELLKSIETFEKPQFIETLEPKELERQEVKVETLEDKAKIPVEIFKPLKEQKLILEKLNTLEKEIREGVFCSVIQSLENAINFTKDIDLIGRFKSIKESSNLDNFQDIISFINELTEMKILSPERIEPPKIAEITSTQKEEKVISKPEETVATKILKVDEEKINRLMNLIGELVVAKNSLLYLSKKIDTDYEIPQLSKEMKSQYSVVNRIAEEMQDAIMQVRMIPVATVFQRFPRLVRDISKKLGKQVKLLIEGEDTEADKNVIEALGDPLIHLVRNSLDHGIETPEERINKGKPEIATITLRAKHEADRVIIQIEDDGKGIDPQKIKRKAYESGLISEETLEKLTDDEALNLIFLPGFSTKETASELSGRGVGMDVVKAMVDRFNGTVSVSSEKDRGTTITLSLPLSMAVSHVMVIETANRKYGIPMDAVFETVRLKKENIHIFKGKRTASLRGKVLPIFFLNDLLELNTVPLTNEDGEYALLVLNIRGEIAGVVVDNFLGTADIILKPFSGFLSSLRIFSGTAIMGDGSVLLIINPKELI